MITVDDALHDFAKAREGDVFFFCVFWGGFEIWKGKSYIIGWFL